MASKSLRERILDGYDRQYVEGKIDFLEYERVRDALFPEEEEVARHDDTERWTGTEGTQLR